MASSPNARACARVCVVATAPRVLRLFAATRGQRGNHDFVRAIKHKSGGEGKLRVAFAAIVAVEVAALSLSASRQQGGCRG